MFNNLVESDLHQQERVRRSWFFLGTLAAYAVLLLFAGVASIYAFDARLDELTAEYEVTFVPPVETSQPQAQPRDRQPRAANNTPAADVRQSTRTDFYARINNSTTAPATPSAAPLTVPELPPGDVKLGPENIDARAPYNPSRSSGGDGSDITGGPTNVVVNIPDTPPPPRAAPTPQPKKILRVTKVLNGQAIFLPKPTYPQAAKIVKAYGTVTVQVLIDETGRVVSAQAVSGHTLLRTAAAQAAQQARFSPTILGDQPVKVSGVITYNFIL